MCEDEASSRKTSEAAETDVVVKMEVTPDLGFNATEADGVSDDPGTAPGPVDVWIKVEALSDDSHPESPAPATPLPASPPVSPLPATDSADLLIPRSFKNGDVSLKEEPTSDPHVCACGRAFPTATRLAQHAYTHDRTPDNTCNKCGRACHHSIKEEDVETLDLRKGIMAGGDNPRNENSSQIGAESALRIKGAEETQIGSATSTYPPAGVLPFSQAEASEPGASRTNTHAPTRGGQRRHLSTPSGVQIRRLAVGTIAQQFLDLAEKRNNIFRELANQLGRLANVLRHRAAKFERAFTLESNLRKHQRTTCQRPPPTCSICCKVFKRKYFLQSHMKKHESARPFPCSQCDLAFKFKSTLNRHQLIHENLKLFPCEVCGKRFTTAALIKPHMRMHTKEKPFQCPICLKKFSHKHNMQRHSLRHNKIKHLICEVCHKEFPKESRLKYHMRVHWTDNKPFKCLHCKKTYSHKQNIVRHYKKKHPNEEYIAPDTDAGLATKAWEILIQQKQSEITDYIVPEIELDKEENGVKTEVNDFGLEDVYSENDSDSEEAKPEIVFVEPKVENESSDSESSEEDEEGK